MFGRKRQPAPQRPPVPPSTGRSPQFDLSTPGQVTVTFPPALPEPERGSVSSAARKLRHRGRHGLKPWLALVLLTALGAGAHAMRRGGAGAALAAVAAIVAAVIVWRRTSGHPVTRWFSLVSAALAGGWLQWVTAAGVGRTAMAVLLAIWLPPALAWWYHWKTRRRPLEEPPVPAEPDQLLEDLRAHVCGQGGRVAGATVSELPRVTGGRQFRFSLVRGKQTIDTVVAARKEIASAAGVSRDRVVAEEMPSDVPGEAGPEHLAMVTILDPRHPQHEIQEFAGPTLDPASGLFDVGPYPDGQMAHARLFKVDEHGRPIRAATGITAGVTGSGKSRYAERKTLEHLASGLFQVVLLDGQSGASIPTLAEYVGWAALPPPEWSICLRAMIRLMIARTRLIAAKKIPHWDPELGPFVQVFIEEAHRPLGIAANLLAVKHGVQESEKVGIGWDISTQFPSQVELGASSGSPGANVLRDLASGGNVTMFRTGGPFAKSVLVGDIEVDPRKLPQRPGMCHPLGVSMRTAPARNIRAEDPVAWAAQYTAPPFSALDIAALDGADSAYSGRLERLAAHTTVPEAASLDIGDLDAEAGMILGEVTRGQPGPVQRAQKATAIELIWEIICEHGRVKRAGVIAELKARGHTYSDSAVDQALASLEGTRRVAKVPGEHGVWERVTTLSIVGKDG
jgi:hypothetical protein